MLATPRRHHPSPRSRSSSSCPPPLRRRSARDRADRREYRREKCELAAVLRRPNIASRDEQGTTRAGRPPRHRTGRNEPGDRSDRALDCRRRRASRWIAPFFCWAAAAFCCAACAAAAFPATMACAAADSYAATSAPSFAAEFRSFSRSSSALPTWLRTLRSVLNSVDMAQAPPRAGARSFVASNAARIGSRNALCAVTPEFAPSAGIAPS